jgi:hypothetical protein
MPNLEVRIGAVAISILLAWLTYELIEKPIRFGKFGKVKAITLLLSMCVVGGVGVGTQKGYFYPRSHSLAALQYFEFSGYPAPDGEYVEDKYKFGAIGNNETDKILLIGDSHSEQYRNTLAKLLAAQSATGHIQPQVMYSLDYLGPDGLLQTSKKVLEDRTISTVIISNFWALTYGSDKINYAIRCCGNALGGSVGGDAYHEPQTSEQMAEIDIKVETVARSLIESGKKVYLILDNPFGEELAPRSLVSRSFFNGVKVRTTPLSKDKAVQRAEPARSRIIGIARRTGAKIIDPFDYLCDQETCPSLSSDGTPIYKDYDHLSIYAVTHRVNYLDFALHK